MRRSGRNNPCPVCGRNTDGDCRWNDDVIFCHVGSKFSPPDHLQIGDLIDLNGEQWALVKTGGGYDNSAHIFKPHQQRYSRPDRQIDLQQRRALQHINDVYDIRPRLVEYEHLANKVLAIPPLEQMLDSDVKHARDDAERAHTAALSLISMLTRLIRHDATYTPVLEELNKTQRKLRFQLDDLNNYCAAPGKYYITRYVLPRHQNISINTSDIDNTQSDYAYWATADTNYRPQHPDVKALFTSFKENQ